MNHGMKIIVACSILCGIIFAASIVVSFLGHKELRDYHEKQFASLCLAAPAGADWAEAEPKLKQAHFEVMQLEEKNGVRTFACGWQIPEKAKRLQNTRLGIPTGAVIKVGADNKIRSVEGVEADLCSSPSKD